MLPSEINPATVMIANILKLQETVPFRPFTVKTSDGRSYEILTPDHITVTRHLRHIEIESDDYKMWTINPLHITSIVEHPATMV